MLSYHRARSLLFAFCAFIAFVLMNGGAVVSTHVAGAMAQSAAKRSLLAAMPDAHAASGDSTWQKASDDASGSSIVLAGDNDVDDEPVLPSPVNVPLDYFLSAAPSSDGTASYSAPVAFLLRPPNLA
jgi:hypothetical protein